MKGRMGFDGALTFGYCTVLYSQHRQTLVNDLDDGRWTMDGSG
jgi:hypothetical protein